jgi:MFS family permease
VPRRWFLLPLIALLMLMPSTLPVPVLKGLVQERFGLSVGQTSWFMAIQMIGAFVAAPLAGVLSDQLAARVPIVVGALLLDALAIWTLSQDLPFGWFLAVRFCDGAAHITALSVLMALAVDGAGPERRGRALGLLGSGLTLGVTMGASLGGIIGRDDPLRALHVGAGLAGAAALLAATVLREVPRTGVRPPLREGLTLLLHERALLAPIAFAFVDRFTVGFFTSVFPLWLRTIHHLPADRIGILLGAFLLPFSLLSYGFGRLAERWSRTALVCWGSAVYGLGTAGLGLLPPQALWVAMPLLGVFAAVMFVPTMVLTADLAGQSRKGAVMGAFNAAGSLGFVLGPLVGGAVVDAVGENPAGFAAAFAVAGASELVCVAATLPLLLRLARAGRTT